MARHKYSKVLARDGCACVRCNVCPFAVANDGCMLILADYSEEIPRILSSEATWRLWCELQGHTPANAWLEEEDVDAS